MQRGSWRIISSKSQWGRGVGGKRVSVLVDRIRWIGDVSPMHLPALHTQKSCELEAASAATIFRSKSNPAT